MGVKRLGPLADMLVINVSSPNTPGLRGMQRRDVLETLLSKVIDERKSIKQQLPIIVKVAPDLKLDELTDVGLAAKNVGIDGIIVSNTTIDRPDSLKSELIINKQTNSLTLRDLGENAKEVGGLSGKPLLNKSVKAIKELYISTDGKIPLIGCGGISSGKDALEFAKAGASLVQLYTALGYQGVGLPRRIKDEITLELQKQGISSWQAIVGTDNLSELSYRRWKSSYEAAIKSLTVEVNSLLDRVQKLSSDSNTFNNVKDNASDVVQKGVEATNDIKQSTKRLVQKLQIK